MFIKINHKVSSNLFLYRFALVSFLYYLANGMVSFILPVFLEDTVKSLTLVGLILASSSVWNIVTDFVISFLKKPPSYRFYMQLTGMMVVALFLSIWLWETPVTLILATVLWGIFTELFSFAKFDFVITNAKDKEQATQFGLIGNFTNLGFALAPIIIGFAMVVSHRLALFTGLFFALATLALFNLFLWLKKMPPVQKIRPHRHHAFEELKLWWKIGHKIYPYLIVFLIKGIADGVLTSFVPIFVESEKSLVLVGGLIIAGLSLPTAFLSVFFGKLADHRGRKKIILLGLLVSSISLFYFGFVKNPIIGIVLAFLNGLGYSLYFSALDAELTSYVKLHHNQEAEVTSESGIFYNFGFIIGAAATGFLTTMLGGFGQSFMVLAFGYLLVFVLFWWLAPRRNCLKDGVVG